MERTIEPRPRHSPRDRTTASSRGRFGAQRAKLHQGLRNRGVLWWYNFAPEKQGLQHLSTLVWSPMWSPRRTSAVGDDKTPTRHYISRITPPIAADYLKRLKQAISRQPKTSSSGSEMGHERETFADMDPKVSRGK